MSAGMRKAAVGYARRGWSPIPLKERSKVPSLARVAPYLSSRATKEELKAWPWSGVGVVTGPLSGVVVIDADGEEGMEELKRRGHPPTPTVRTGGGGLHLYFRHPGAEIRTAIRVAPGLDVKGSGGYVVAPPSVHPSGNAYEWLISPDEAELAELPQWALGVLRGDPSRNGSAPPVGESIPEGRRNGELVSLGGSMRRRGMDEEEIFAALFAVNRRRCEPPLDEGEVRKIAQSLTQYEPEQTAPFRDNTNTTNTDSEEDKEFVELPDAPPFPVDCLPESCRRFVREAAVSLGCAPDLVAVPLLGLLSAAIGNSRQVQLKRGWKESATLFAVVVAEPGDKKTPAQKAALAPLWQAQKRFKKEYQEEYEVYEEELRYWEVERKVAAKDGQPAPPKPKEPVLKSVVVDDVTVERLADILDENPRGVTSAQDELSGWVLSMNQYKAGGKGADRQFWLRVWSNAPVKVDRKSRKVPAIIPEPWVSVVGSIQPEILPELNIGRNDGMTDRFLYSYPEPQRVRHTDEVVSAGAEHAVQNLYDKLADLKMPESDGEPFPSTVPMTKEAWEVFKEIAGELSEEAHDFSFPRRLRGAWSKLEAYLARLSLILALSRVTEGNESEQVEPRDVFVAGVLVDYFKAHARRVFAELHGADPMDSLAVALSEFLEEHDSQWEGTATELFDALSERQAEGLPGNLDNLAAKVLAIARRSKAVHAERGWRGKSRVLRMLLLKNGVGSVGGVGERVPQASCPLGRCFVTFNTLLTIP